MEISVILSIVAFAAGLVLSLASVAACAFVLHENIRVKSDIVQLTQSITGTVKNVDLLIQAVKEFEEKRINAESDRSNLHTELSALSSRIETLATSIPKFNGDLTRLIQRLSAAGDSNRTIEGEATQA